VLHACAGVQVIAHSGWLSSAHHLQHQCIPCKQMVRALHAVCKQAGAGALRLWSNTVLSVEMSSAHHLHAAGHARCVQE